MNIFKKKWAYILVLLLVSGCSNEQELPTDILIESALSDAKANGVNVRYIVKGEFATKDSYTLSDGSIIQCMTIEELFIQNHTPALKVVNISGTHVKFAFLSNKHALSNPISRKVSVGEKIISYEID